MASISHRISIAWPPDSPSEPTSTIVLTTPERRFVDIRASLPLQNRELHWGIAGVSRYNPETRTGTWKHDIDSRSDDPQEDSGVMSDLDNGDVLEKGTMVDFEDGKLKQYEEIWRDEHPGIGSLILAVACNGENLKGSAIRMGNWCQALLKTKGKMSSGRWKLNSRGEWDLEFSSGEWAWENDWPAQIPDDGEKEISGICWAVVERTNQG